MAQDSANLEKIFDYIDSLEVTERAARVRVEPTDLFPVLLVMLIAVAMGRLTVRETWLRRSP
jgi:hypothetical protein